MKKGIDYPFQMTGFFAAGLVLAVVVIIVFFMPKMLYAAYGPCWSNTYTDLQDMKSQLSYLTASETRTSKIAMGDCVGGIVVFKKGYFTSASTEFGKFMSGMEDEYCPKYAGYNSYILMLPWKTVKDQAQSDAGIFGKLKQSWQYYSGYAKRLWESSGREALIKPSCFGVEGLITDKNGNTAIYIPQNLEKSPENLNEAEQKFCYSLSKVSTMDGFAYRMEPAAASQCPGMETK